MSMNHQLQAACLGFLVAFGASAQAAPSPKLYGLLDQAKSSANTPAELEKIAGQILSIDAKSGDAYAILEAKEYVVHNLDGAIKQGQKAVALKFEDKFWKRSANNYLYHCYVEKKDWAKALPVAEACYKIEPTAAVAHDLSLLYSKTGNTKLAKDYAQIAEKSGSAETEQFKQKLVNLQHSRDPKNVNSALTSAEAALAKDPKDLDALLLRAHCYNTKKLYAKELKDFDTLIALSPKHGMFYHGRAEVYTLLGDKKKSEADEAEAKRLGFDADQRRADFMHKLKIRALPLNATTGSGVPAAADNPKRKPD